MNPINIVISAGTIEINSLSRNGCNTVMLTNVVNVNGSTDNPYLHMLTLYPLLAGNTKNLNDKYLRM